VKLHHQMSQSKMLGAPSSSPAIRLAYCPGGPMTKTHTDSGCVDCACATAQRETDPVQGLAER
jgi:hypothetical protein